MPQLVNLVLCWTGAEQYGYDAAYGHGFDTGLSSRSTGHSGSGINLALMQFSCHHTSIFGIGTSLFPRLLHIRIAVL
jgi:hypothetical protein